MIVELSKLDDVLKKPIETMTDLEKFSVFFEYAANPEYRDTVNKVIESEEVLTVASNLLMNISQDERERAIFRSRKKFQMDYASDIATARDNGREEGRAEERAEAETKLKEKLLNIVQNLLELNMSVDQIVMATGATREDVESQRIIAH